MSNEIQKFVTAAERQRDKFEATNSHLETNWDEWCLLPINKASFENAENKSAYIQNLLNALEKVMPRFSSAEKAYKWYFTKRISCLGDRTAVSYTHLTLPTILRV